MLTDPRDPLRFGPRHADVHRCALLAAQLLTLCRRLLAGDLFSSRRKVERVLERSGATQLPRRDLRPIRAPFVSDEKALYTACLAQVRVIRRQWEITTAYYRLRDGISRAVETHVKCVRGRLFVVEYANGLLSLRSATAAVTYLRTVPRLGLVGGHVDAVKAGGSTCLTEAST